MRRLLLISIIIAALGGCDAERVKVQSHEQDDVYVVEVEGHKYVIYHGFYAGGIVHAESCPCRLKTLSDSISYFEDGF